MPDVLKDTYRVEVPIDEQTPPPIGKMAQFIIPDDTSIVSVILGKIVQSSSDHNVPIFEEVTNEAGIKTLTKIGRQIRTTVVLEIPTGEMVDRTVVDPTTKMENTIRIPETIHIGNIPWGKVTVLESDDQKPIIAVDVTPKIIKSAEDIRSHLEAQMVKAGTFSYYKLIPPRIRKDGDDTDTTKTPEPEKKSDGGQS